MTIKRQRWSKTGAGVPARLGKATLQKCAAVPKRARIQGSLTFVSLNARLESNKEKKRIHFHARPFVGVFQTSVFPTVEESRSILGQELANVPIFPKTYSGIPPRRAL